MNILVIGEEENFNECQVKFGTHHHYLWERDHREAEKFLINQHLVFDFTLDDEPACFEMYAQNTTRVFINTSKVSLGDLTHSCDNKVSSLLFGFNGMPTFLNRNILEVSLWKKEDEAKLIQICRDLRTDYLLVDDRVGLVTPRVVCMIINEAYYAVQEGTASRSDIDIAMRLGTNYPYGPFEWCTKIGIKHVYELLEAVYEDTKDERYKICPLLKKEYYRS
ncbi:MAG TPA: 3-hydroxyacyl-CoA dehydrogenase family protein [Cyclobacteriaceae bacterium]|jgi:3-hydroxybutyryl-CoA dehydrogenase|nr:3-hydroxyacyl-CoA dehydrogenase family protein [Cyclobacteriaceae bacterium]